MLMLVVCLRKRGGWATLHNSSDLWDVAVVCSDILHNVNLGLAVVPVKTSEK